MLCDRKYNFRDGINSILSKNGTGKSTLVGFIKAMLYGIGETRKLDISENDRKRYMPWQGGRFGGSLTFTVGEKSYTVERSFGAKASLDEFRLIDTRSGAPSQDYTENLGEELFGIDREGFERTVLFSEKQLLGKNDNKSISGKLSDLVGTEFDIGEYDKAMSLLEEKRKFYFKRGGGGEIGTLKKELSLVQGSLDSLSRLGEKSSAESEQINALKVQIHTLEERAEKIRANVERIGIIKENLAKEAVYRDMLTALMKEEEKLKGIKAFFKGDIPFPEELEKIEKKHSQLRAIMERRDFSASDEYIALDAFFKNHTSFEEIDAMCELNSATESLIKEKAEIARYEDESAAQMRRLFPKLLPKRADIEKMSRLPAAKSIKRSPVMLVICALMFTLGVVFGFAVSYFAFIASAIAVVIFIFTGNKKEVNSELSDYVFGIDPSLSDMPAHDALIEIEKRLDLYEQLSKDREDRLEILNEKINEKKSVIFAFLGKFPLTGSGSIGEALRQIKEKYLKYYSMQMAREHIASTSLDNTTSANQLKEEITVFLSKFNTKTTAPLDEIRRMLSEYQIQSNTVKNMREQCADYKARHSLVGKSEPTEMNGQADVSTLKRITDEIALKREELQRLLGEHDATLSEFARRDELIARQNLLIEKIEKYEYELSTVQNTILFLKRACDNITDRYLGKTVEGFKKYQKDMSGNDGDFSLDTEFSLSRTEGSQTHPESSYSRGTRDLYALAIRLSLLDSLYEGEAPFIILDDPFIAFDDEKVKRAVSVLKKLSSTRQIIYLTCSEARAI